MFLSVCFYSCLSPPARTAAARAVGTAGRRSQQDTEGGEELCETAAGSGSATSSRAEQMRGQVRREVLEHSNRTQWLGARPTSTGSNWREHTTPGKSHRYSKCTGLQPPPHDSECRDSRRHIQDQEETPGPTAASLHGKTSSWDSFCSPSHVLRTQSQGSLKIMPGSGNEHFWTRSSTSANRSTWHGLKASPLRPVGQLQLQGVARNRASGQLSRLPS